MLALTLTTPRMVALAKPAPVSVEDYLEVSTRRIDLTEKREAYLAVPTLKVLVLIEPDFAHATVHRRSPTGGFVVEDYVGIEAVVPLPDLEIELRLGEVYEGLDSKEAAK